MDWTPEDWKNYVTEAYKLSREGRLLELSTSLLAQTDLVTACFLPNVPISADVRGRTLQSVLRWATHRLRPSGEQSWTAYAWRAYNTLHSFYFDGLRVAELAEQMAISEQTFYWSRGEAMTTVAQLMSAECDNPQDLQGRRYFTIEDRYARLTPSQQTTLRLLAAFQREMPTRLVHQLAIVPNVQEQIHHLVATNWVVSDETGEELLLHPELRDYLQTRLTPNERQRWHQAMGEHAQTRQNYMAAATHFLRANRAQDSAEILLNHYNDIVNDLQAEEMLHLIDQFASPDLHPKTWAQLKIAAGDAAYLLRDLDSAIAAYQAGMAARDTAVKALAYYRRAKVLELRNLDEALAHYSYSIQLLERDHADDLLLVRVYIHRAILFIEERPDNARAEVDLQRASELIDPEIRSDWSLLQSAWFRLRINQLDWERAVESGQQAWMAASEIQHVDRMILTAHNLGMVYTRTDRFEQGLAYLERSQQLAHEMGNRQYEALNATTIGGGHFMAQQYDQAETYYAVAYRTFHELGNQNWLAHTCYNLAELYATTRQVAQMQQYFTEGVTLAEQLGDKRLLAEFTELRDKHADFLTDLTARQHAALEFVRQHGKITNADYQRINDVSSRQSLRDLRELESAGLLERVGQGRSTHYRPI